MREGIIVLVSCQANRPRWPRIRAKWLDAVGIPYVFVVGDANATCPLFDEATRVLSVPCDDTYDSLPKKVATALREVRARFQPDFVIKVDDDVVASPTRLASLAQLPATVEYGGRAVVHDGSTYGVEKFVDPAKRVAVHVNTVYCTGPVYYLNARALDVLASHMDESDACPFEDVLVGVTLRAHGINAVALPIYTDSESAFSLDVFAAWHDTLHAAPQNAA